MPKAKLKQPKPVPTKAGPDEQDVLDQPGVITTPGAENLQKNSSLPKNYEIGTTGLAQFSGLIFEEPLVELRSKEAYKRYDEMRRNSPIIAGLLLSIENPIRSTAWDFTSELGQDDPRLELIDKAIANMSHSWNSFISEVLTMLPFGFSIFEPVYEMVGGDVLWKKLAPRSQNTVLRWIYKDVQQTTDDPSAPVVQELIGFEQQAPPKYKLTPIPLERIVIFKLHEELENPEGRSMLRSAWKSYYYVKHIEQIEAIGIERDLAGLPMIELPEGATTDGANSDYQKAAKVVRNVRNDQQAGLVIPNGWTFSLLHSGGSKQMNVNETISRHIKDMLTSSLAQFLMLGQQGIGSMALSKDQTDFFTMSVNAVADIIASTITSKLLPQLMKLNGYTADGLRAEHTPAQGELGIQILSDVIQKAAPYMHWTAEDEVWLRQAIGMPEKSVDELQVLFDEDNSAQAAIAANAALAKQGQPVMEQTPPALPAEGQTGDINLRAELMAAKVKDKAKRDQLERKLQKAVKDYQARLKKQVMSAARRLQ